MKGVSVLVIGLLSFMTDEITDPSKFPVPPYTTKSLFYIHRSTNSNTVVYELNTSSGNLIDKETPVKVYWIRYDEKGQERQLNYLERNFAYGVKCSALSGNKYAVEFVASGKKTFEVFMDEVGQAVALMNINGVPSKLRKVYVHVAEDGWWPKIDYVDFFGFDISSNQPTYERLKI